MKKLLIIILVISLNGCFFNNNENTNITMIDLSKMSLNEVKEYAKEKFLELKIEEEYSLDIQKNNIISQNIAKDTSVKRGSTLEVVVSLGPVPVSVYQDNKVNELGNIPIMMYHGIVNKQNEETLYTGGNVDKDGYNRTKEAFIKDLEMYYQNNYRMIRLNDYIEGNIDVALGKSPIVLTFDDGNANNFNVLDVDNKGNLIIDPNCAVGILETFKSKYPDYNVTATFFLNGGLFGQPKYNNQIIKWLVDNGYDIGNHTKNHVNFNNINELTTQSEIAYMYKLFDNIIPNKYTPIIALPFGSPDKKTHSNFPFILEGSNDGYNYKTISTLRVGWEPNYSPFHKKFDKTYMKRVRAWDNNGKDFDIEMVFNNLKSNRYISDGNPNTIVISNDANLNTEIKNMKIIKY